MANRKPLNNKTIDIIMKSMSPDIRAQYEYMTSEEREVLLMALSDPDITKALYELDFRTIPVSANEYLSDPYFVGPDYVWDPREHRGLYPKWKEELCYVLDPENGVYEHILSGSLGAGKTTCALVSQMYWIYWLTCLRDPHEYLGLLPSAPIEIFLFSISLTTVEDAGLARFERLINGSPYFRDTFPVNRRRRKRSSSNKGLVDYKLEFPPYLEITEGSRDTHFISRDIIGGMLDEANFIPQPKRSGTLSYDATSKAFNLYQGLRNRIESRFMKQGKVVGLLCLISSAATRHSFLEHHKKRQRDNPHVRISEFPLYDVKPWEYRGPKFFVLLGTEHANSRIVSEPEADAAKLEGKVIVEVPTEHKDAYERDLPRALKEISGIPSEIVSPLIPIKECIQQSIIPTRVHPFQVLNPVIGHLSSTKIEDLINPEHLAKWEGKILVPKYHGGMRRFIHVDLSASDLPTGFAMGCISRTTDIKITGPDNKTTLARAPIIWFDILLQIVPPDAPEQVGYQKIRNFIKYLRDILHFNIGMVSFDGWQCVSGETRIWTNKGMVPAREVSVGDIVQSRVGPRSVVKKWEFGKKPVFKVVTDDGHTICITENHKLEVAISWKIKNNGRRNTECAIKRKLNTGRNSYNYVKRPVWGWVRARDLKPGMVIRSWDGVTSVGQEKLIQLGKVVEPYRTNSNVNLPNYITEDFAEWLGLVWADGCIHPDFVMISGHREEFDTIMYAWKKVVHDPSLVKLYKDSENGIQTKINSRYFKRFLDSNRLRKNGKIPELIMRSPVSVQAAFVRGLFSGDGNVRKSDGRVSFSTVNQEWASYVQDFLRMAFSIESTITVAKKGKYKDAYVVSIRGPRSKFQECVGFLPGKKSKLLGSFSNIKGEKRWTKIKSVGGGWLEDVFDFEVEGDHSYLANGLVSHNSFDSMQLLQNEGFETDILSMDKKIDQYFTLKTAFLERRIERYAYPPLDEELPYLQLVNEGGKQWVERSANTNTKDISDAVCGVIWWCTQEHLKLGDSEIMKQAMVNAPNSSPLRPFMPIGR